MSRAPLTSGHAEARSPTPDFSVLIATYQAAATIGDALESLLGQSVPPREVIVIDDGSEDGTDQIVAGFGARVRYVRQPNQGAPSALNRGVRMAEGEFVATLDADDVYERERLAELGRLAARRPELDLLMSDATIEQDGTALATFCQETPFATTDQDLAILDRCFVAWPAIRRSRLIAVGGYSTALRIAYDWECHLRLIIAGAQAGLVPQPLLRYRLWPGSLAGDRVAALRERVTVLEVAAGLALRPSARVELELLLPLRRHRAGLVAAQAALVSGAPDARRLALELARLPGVSPQGRVRAVTAAVAPGLARRALRLRGLVTSGDVLARHSQTPPGDEQAEPRETPNAE
jgi:hypothetical protein